MLSACLRMLSTDPKASTARDRLTLLRDRRLRFEQKAMLEDASHCYTAARSCDVRPPTCSIEVSPGLLPKPVVGWITHHSPGVVVLEPILATSQVCVKSPAAGTNSANSERKTHGCHCRCRR